MLTSQQIVFIDSQVADYQFLASGVKPGIEVVVLKSDRDGIEQITEVLSQRNSYTSIHIVSHGSPGCIYLGNTQLNINNIDSYQNYLRQWFYSLSIVHCPLLCEAVSFKTIALYGCNVATGDAGEEFITKLQDITGASIAASTTPIGNADLGGNWELDSVTEAIAFSPAFNAKTQQSYAGILEEDPLAPELAEELNAEIVEDLPTVTTDKQDYAPGSTATITGENFKPGETVELEILHNDGTPNTGGGHDPWQVTDGGAGDLDNKANGTIITTWFVNPDDSLNSAFDLTATGLNSGKLAAHSFTDSDPAIQFFYVPFEEDNIETVFDTLDEAGDGRDVNQRLDNVLSITISTDNTIVYYDHWEDGYETDINNPIQGSTKVWGDNDDSNGSLADLDLNLGFTTDELKAGDIIALEDTITTDTDPNTQPTSDDPNNPPFGGRDKIGSSKAVIVTRQVWSNTNNVGSLLAGASEILDTSKWGTEFIAPVGEDTSTDNVTPSDNNMFEYSSLFVSASQDATNITVTNVNSNNVDENSDGNLYDDTVTATLDEGETSFIQNVGVGATVNSGTKPIQAHLVTGDVEDQWESRWYTLFPKGGWSNTYYTPVGETVANRPVDVFLYNPEGNGTITVTSSENTEDPINNVAASNTFTIDEGEVAHRRLQNSSAVRFSTGSNGSDFFAIATVDSPTNNGDNLDAAIADWGFSLIPDTNLTPIIQVGWGIGSEDNAQNGSPLWVTTTAPTTIYVDYDGDGVAPNTDINGGQYDEAFTLEELESRRIFDTRDNNQTGIKVYTIDGTGIIAAWGQDPSTAVVNNSNLDLGTTVLPLPVAHSWKTSELVTGLNANGDPGDVNADGNVDPGDTIEYTINVKNDGVVILGNVNVTDIVPDGTTYVSGSTKVNGLSIGDDTSGTAFPLDNDSVDNGIDSGRNIGNVNVDESATVSFEVEINNPYNGALDGVTNSAIIDSDEDTFTVAVNTPVEIPIETKTLYLSDTNDLDRIDPANSQPIDNSNSTASLSIVSNTIENAFDSDWNEINDGDNDFGNGNVVVSGGELQLDDNPDSGGEPGIERAIDLSGANSATLSFDFATGSGVDASDVVTLDISDDGGSNYTTLETFTNISGTNSGSKIYNLENDIDLTENTEVRFRVTNLYGGPDETFTVSNIDITSLTGDTETFNQSVSMQSDFEMPEGNPVIITAYLDVNNTGTPTTASNIAIDLTYGSPATTIATLTNPTSVGTPTGTVYPVTWTTTLNDNVTIPADEDVSFEITNNDPNLAFDLLYDSATYPSKIDFATRSIIDVTSVGVYDAAGGGNQINASADGEEVYIRVEVEDPFGDYDITGLDIDITDPNNNALTTIPLDSADDIDTTVDGKRIYESAWTPPSTLGEFTINVEAQEGLEGTVVDTGSTTHTVNNGNVPNVLIGDDIVTEGTSLIFDVDLSTTSITDIVLDLAATDGTATGTSDYETTGFEYSTDGGTTWIPAGGTNGTEVTIPSGSLGIKVRIDSVSDNADEPDETFTLGVNNVISGDVGDTSDTGTGTITDNDPTPNISIGDAQIIEGDTGQKVLTFAVTLDSPSSQSVTVDYTTTDVSATSNDSSANDDYVAETGTVTFPPGETSAEVTINTIGDTRIESNETFTVDLSNPANANIADGSGTGTIIDDDQTSVFSIGNASVVEGDSGTTTLKFTVTRTGSTSGTASVDFATADNTATTANSDYVSQTDTLNFTDGEPSKTISITINGDDAIEADETFFVNLTNPVDGTINNAQGVGTIVNDDLSGTISGNVKADTNDDNVGDQNLSGVTITLTSGGVDGIIDDDLNTSEDESADNIIVTKLTDTSGNYSFENLEEDTYRVEQTNLAGYDDLFEFDRIIDSVDDDTDLEDNATDNDNQLTVVLLEGETDSGNDFVDEPLGSISGTVKVDNNGDSVGDQPLEGVTITLFKDGTQIGDSILTNSSGGYSFDDIPSGDYTVVQTNSIGYYDVTDSQGANDSTVNVSLDPGETSLGNDFVDELRIDYGDAADSLSGAVSAADNLANNGNDIPDYQTTEDDGGPSHPIVPDLSMGSAPDADDGTLQNAAADADDTDPTNSTNDEDGVTGFDTLVTNTDIYTINVDVTNNLSGDVDATLVGWIDFDRNGSFDADEAVSTTVTNGATSVSLTWDNTDGDTNNDIPSDVASGTTYARFRLSSDSLTTTDSTGSASDGEVEDYQVDIKNGVDGTGGSEVINSTTGIKTTAGNDFVTAGAGQDTLTGGAGDDCYHFNITSDGIDVITDFDDNGNDKLDFRDIFNDELSSLTIPPNSNPFDTGYVEAIAFGTGVMIIVDTDSTDSGDDVLNKPVVLLRNTAVSDINASDFIF